METVAEIRRQILQRRSADRTSEFTTAIVNGYIHPRDYARALAQLWQVYDLIEKLILNRPAIAKQLVSASRRAATIQRDVLGLGFDLSEFSPLPQTLAIAERIKSWASESPNNLLAIYVVLENGRNGGIVAERMLRRALNLASDKTLGLEFHLDHVGAIASDVSELNSRVDSLPMSSEERSAFIRVAVEFSELFASLLDALPTSEKISRPRIPSYESNP